MVEMAITLAANSTTSFFFVSDMYSAGEVRAAINTTCIDVTVSDPISFNSTGNLQPGSVVQYYRGDTAAILLQGYEDAKEVPGSPNLVPNPPFPPNVNMAKWECLNSTIGESIPLMNGASGFPRWGIALIFIVPVLVLCFLWCARGGDGDDEDEDEDD